KMVDSAGYSLPKPKDVVGYDTSQIPTIRSQQLQLSSVFKAQNEINSNRITGYLQRNWNYRLKDTSELSFTAGIRTNYWTFNNENVISPRASVAYKPNWKRDYLFRLSGGYYYQAPLYRELRNFEGELNENIEAQKSVQIVAAADYNFKAWDRPFKWTTEVYYKHMTNIIPYEIDNVRIRYYAENNANAYATGIDMKVNGEFVKGVESWATFGLMKTEEDISNDFYYDYFNSDGEKVIPGFTFNQVVVDSIRNEPGYIPRPTDNRFNFSVFFQDYLPNNPTLKANITFHFATGLPFGPPSYERYKDTLRIPSYLRVDIGFTKILKGEDKVLSEKNPFRHFNNISLSAQVFNLLQRNNTISYLWVSDVSNRQYAVPNYLTSRQLNVMLQFTF
ncbi:TonB-dependent receptor, partial [Vicingaceae bacterium]|nr:TonB-dependent receptor [Vicingaceae bacterium]